MLFARAGRLAHRSVTGACDGSALAERWEEWREEEPTERVDSRELARLPGGVGQIAGSLSSDSIWEAGAEVDVNRCSCRRCC